MSMAHNPNSVLAHTWTTFLTRHDTKDGREVQMPEWVCDHACRNVDLTDAAAIRRDPDGWRVCNAYAFDETIEDEPMDIDEARDLADSYNRARGVVPLVIPRSWAIVDAPAPTTPTPSDLRG
jgi:hypothetical protein